MAGLPTALDQRSYTLSALPLILNGFYGFTLTIQQSGLHPRAGFGCEGLADACTSERGSGRRRARFPDGSIVGKKSRAGALARHGASVV
jgi:hypothetical protein